MGFRCADYSAPPPLLGAAICGSENCENIRPTRCDPIGRRLAVDATARVLGIRVLSTGTESTPIPLQRTTTYQGRMEYFEDLPESCPLADAVEADGTWYRLLSTKNPKEKDFWSHKKKGRPALAGSSPNVICCFSGLSIWDTLANCQNAKKLQTQQKAFIARVTIASGCGRLCRTFDTEGHHTWWPAKDFNHEDCELEVITIEG